MNNELVEYIEKKIFTLYDRNEDGHKLKHINTVIERSLEIGKKYDIDVDIVYTVAAYHDLGHFVDRKKHEIISAQMFNEDKNITKWFNDEERQIIKEAIEDHRASSDHKPRSIYGMIVSTADRTIIDIDETIRRTYSYGKKHFPEYTEEELIVRTYDHLNNKYGEDGYAKAYLEDKDFENALAKLREVLKNKNDFINRVKKVVQ